MLHGITHRVSHAFAMNVRKSFFSERKYSELLYQNGYDNSELTYNDMHFIGITGGVGAGKTAILTYLESNYPCRVMLADEIAHDLMEPGTDCYRKLQELFVKDQVFEADGQIDRKRMAQVLFSDEEKRIALNNIVHPAVKQYVIDEMNRERAAQNHEVLILEAALLIEEHYDEICDELWYIYTSEKNRRERLKLNRGYSDEKLTIFLPASFRRVLIGKYAEKKLTIITCRKMHSARLMY